MDDEAKTLTSVPYTWPQRIAAIAIAVISDILNAAFTWAPPIVIGIDIITAALLWLVLGRPMVLLPVFVAEALPGMSLVPLWTLVAAGLAFLGRIPGRGRVGGSPTSPHERPSPTALPGRDPPR